MKNKRAICVYCASQIGTDETFATAATALGNAIGKAGLDFVYGGGTNGLMGVTARAAAEAGAGVTGVIPKFLFDREADPDATGFINNLIVVENMHERKARMFHEADAFVALPGGIGTLEEIIEIMTWAQLGRHQKPIAFVDTPVDGGGFWDPLFDLFAAMSNAGFLHTQSKIKPILAPTGEEVISKVIAEFKRSHETA